MKAKFLGKLCSLLVSASLVLGPETMVCAQPAPDSDFSHPLVLGGTQQISPAVIANTNQAVHQYALKKQSGHLAASDVEVAAAAMKTAFDHLQETGYNAALEKKLLDNPEAFANYHPSDADLAAFQKNLAAEGVRSNASHVRRTLDPQFADRQMFLAMVRSQGLYKTELQMVEHFRMHELQFVTTASSTGTSATLRSQRSKSGARLVEASSGLPWYEAAACVIAAAVGLGSGCTVTMFACEGAVLLCGACMLGC